MNSMYGRFGMRTSLTQTALINRKDLERYTQLFTILSQIDFKEFNLINYILEENAKAGNVKENTLLKEYIKALNQKTNVALASAVTAYSLYKFLKLLGKTKVYF